MKDVLQDKEIRVVLIKIMICISGLLAIRNGLVLGGINMFYLALADEIVGLFSGCQKTVKNIITILLQLLGVLLIIQGFTQYDAGMAAGYMFAVLVGQGMILLRSRTNSRVIDFAR